MPAVSTIVAERNARCYNPTVRIETELSGKFGHSAREQSIRGRAHMRVGETRFIAGVE